MKKLLTIILLIFNALILFGEEYICFSSNSSANKSIFLFQVKSDEIQVVSDSLFSIGDGVKVKFTTGNLVYRKYTDTWSFAKRQIDFVGGTFSGTPDADHLPKDAIHGTIWEIFNGTAIRSTNDSIDNASYKGWTDLFKFGTGDLHGSDIITGKVYRTPTENEYKYLLNTRPNARKLRGRARIVLPGNGGSADTIVNGLIILPDNWNPTVLPNHEFVSDEDGCDYYKDNVYTLNEWNLLESYGAVFLPAAGTRDGQTKYNRSGYYWTGTTNSTKGVSMEFGGYIYNNNPPEDPVYQRGIDKNHRRAIRLIQIVE